MFPLCSHRSTCDKSIQYGVHCYQHKLLQWGKLQQIVEGNSISLPKNQTGFAWGRRMKCPSSTTIQMESVSCSFHSQFICGTAQGKNKDDFFSPCLFLHIDALCNVALCWHLYLDNSIKKNQKQDNDKESENLLSQMYFHLIQVKWKNELRILEQIIFFSVSRDFRHTRGFLTTYNKFFLGFCFETYLCGV